MKGLAGGLINRSEAAMALHDAVRQCASDLGNPERGQNWKNGWATWSSTPSMTPDLTAYIEKEQKVLSGDFCRGCGYCMPCPAGIQINTCARMSLMLRRAPSQKPG